ASNASGGGNTRCEPYVVFGGSTPAGTTVTLNALGTGGFTLRGFENIALAGGSVSGAGDVNGDGFADLLVGAYGTDAGGTGRGEGSEEGGVGKGCGAGGSVNLEAEGRG